MTTHDPTPPAAPPRSRRGLRTALLAAAACSVCLLPAVLTTAALSSITGWLTGSTGLVIAAAVLTIGAGLVWVRRRTARQQSPCGCSTCG